MMLMPVMVTMSPPLGLLMVTGTAADALDTDVSGKLTGDGGDAVRPSELSGPWPVPLRVRASVAVSSVGLKGFTESTSRVADRVSVPVVGWVGEKKTSMVQNSPDSRYERPVQSSSPSRKSPASGPTILISVILAGAPPVFATTTVPRWASY